MAYTYPYPMNYQPYYPQSLQNMQQLQNQQPQTPQIQNGGIVTVRSEDEAKNYLVAQGTSVTFRDETAPFIYTKTRGFSPMEQPIFEKFRLVKENEPTSDFPSEDKKSIVYAEKSEIDALQSEIDELRKTVEKLKGSAINEHNANANAVEE